MCLLIGIVAIVLMGLFPPWVLEAWHPTIKHTFKPEPGPYSWIGSPPASEKSYIEYRYGGERKTLYLPARVRFIDLYRLGVQYFIVAVVTTGLIIILGSRKRKTQ